MLEVYICEDDKIQLKMLENQIKNIIIMENYDMEVVLATQNPQEIIEHTKDGFMKGLYFIDINLGNNINGIELAQYIRKHDKRAFIVFITSSDKDYKLTLDKYCEPLDYIVKKINPQERQEMLRKIVHSLYVANERAQSFQRDDSIINYGAISLKLSEHKYVIQNLDDIIWIQKNKDNASKIDIQGEDRVILAKGSLKEILTQLDDRFIRIGKSLIINKNKVAEYDKSQKVIVLKGKNDYKMFAVSFKAMNDFLDIIYPTRKHNIVLKTQKFISNLFEEE